MSVAVINEEVEPEPSDEAFEQATVLAETHIEAAFQDILTKIPEYKEPADAAVVVLCSAVEYAFEHIEADELIEILETLLSKVEETLEPVEDDSEA